MDVFVARQPIFNKTESIFAYELLYRNSQQNSFPILDGDTATLEVLINSFLHIGIKELAEEKLCFINFTENLLDEEVFVRFPVNRIVVEVLEDIPITSELIDKIRTIKALGFMIALDDFVIQKNIPFYQDLFALVNFIKVDFLHTTPEERKAIEQITKRNYPHIVLLAEKVETRQQFQEAIEAGYGLFQGYFFAKPEIFKGADIPANTAQYTRLIGLLRNHSANVEQIAAEIERDVSLTFKVLKMINSPAVRKKSKIRSIKQGVLLLGLEELTHWLYVLLLHEIKVKHVGDSMAIIEASLFRAKFCELLAKRKSSRNASEFFLLGMFSLIDTLLHQSMEKALQDIPISEDIIVTLLGAKTEMTPYLALAIACDEVRWNEIILGADFLNIDYASLNDMYLEARSWASDIIY